MSFLNKILEKKNSLKSCQTLFTSLSGNQYIEEKNEKGEITVKKLSEKCFGFVVDNKLDLQVVHVTNYLFFSSQDVANDIHLLKKHGITHILSLGIDIQPFDEIIHKKIELLDEPFADVLKILPLCLKFIENARTENGNNKILIHCNAGYSRSPSIVIAYLITKYGYSFDECFNFLSKKRSIKPNEGFIKQLKLLEQETLKHGLMKKEMLRK